MGGENWKISHPLKTFYLCSKIFYNKNNEFNLNWFKIHIKLKMEDYLFQSQSEGIWLPRPSLEYGTATNLT